MFCCSLGYCASSKPIAPAIEWWLTQQDKFVGADVTTYRNPDNTYSIAHWNVNGVKQPTDEELSVIVANYELQPKSKSIEERITALEAKSATTP